MSDNEFIVWVAYFVIFSIGLIVTFFLRKKEKISVAIDSPIIRLGLWYALAGFLMSLAKNTLLIFYLPYFFPLFVGILILTILSIISKTKRSLFLPYLIPGLASLGLLVFGGSGKTLSKCIIRTFLSRNCGFCFNVLRLCKRF
jgi:hypothetical protein